jgi:hypothetical protein
LSEPTAALNDISVQTPTLQSLSIEGVPVIRPDSKEFMVGVLGINSSPSVNGIVYKGHSSATS